MRAPTQKHLPVNVFSLVPVLFVPSVRIPVYVRNVLMGMFLMEEMTVSNVMMLLSVSIVPKKIPLSVPHVTRVMFSKEESVLFALILAVLPVQMALILVLPTRGTLLL